MIPELTVSNISQTKEFYLSKLGFHLEYERTDDKFFFAAYEGSQFMFEELHRDGWNTAALEYPFGRGINFSICCKNIDELYEQILKCQIKPYRELHESSYLCGEKVELQKQFLIQDPDGYLLRFTN
jgi:catechol 2,3-dioxygenase-like lactoylglutathione lyase family enzyme